MSAEETKLKGWFRDRYSGWSEAYEPRRGGGMGVPDIQILLDNHLLPIELKIGKLKAHDPDRLYIHKLSPAQVSWHIRFWSAGGIAHILVGVPDEKHKWALYQLPKVSFELMHWRRGWEWSELSRWSRW